LVIRGLVVRRDPSSGLRAETKIEKKKIEAALEVW
jgi:hypothetical protein